jgi:hypothetical protein
LSDAVGSILCRMGQTAVSEVLSSCL